MAKFVVYQWAETMFAVEVEATNEGEALELAKTDPFYAWEEVEGSVAFLGEFSVSEVEEE